MAGLLIFFDNSIVLWRGGCTEIFTFYIFLIDSTPKISVHLPAQDNAADTIWWYAPHVMSFST